MYPLIWLNLRGTITQLIVNRYYDSNPLLCVWHEYCTVLLSNVLSDPLNRNKALEFQWVTHTILSSYVYTMFRTFETHFYSNYEIFQFNSTLEEGGAFPELQKCLLRSGDGNFPFWKQSLLVMLLPQAGWKQNWKWSRLVWQEKSYIDVPSDANFPGFRRKTLCELGFLPHVHPSGKSCFLYLPQRSRYLHFYLPGAHLMLFNIWTVHLHLLLWGCSWPWQRRGATRSYF